MKYCRVDETDVRYTQRICQDVKDCQIDGPLWKGTLEISGLDELFHGGLEGAVRFKLKALTTRGDQRLQWRLNPPQPQPITFWEIKNTSDVELKYEVEPGLWETIGPGETKRYPLTPPKPIPMYQIKDGKWTPANEAAHELAARIAAKRSADATPTTLDPIKYNKAFDEFWSDVRGNGSDSIGKLELLVKAEPEPFFPAKIGRIDKLPRY